jgi:peroxiredoxin Q/BCP
MPISRKRGLEAGAPAPAFTLAREGGGEVSLADFRGRKLVLYFYPKAGTTGCTQEAVDFSGLAKAFAHADAAILGVSADPVAKLTTFHDKHALGIPLATDESLKTLRAYGVWAKKAMYGRSFMGIVRTTFLIDRTGKIARIWPKVRVPGHAEEVLKAAQALE